MKSKEDMINEIKEYANILKEEIPLNLELMNYNDIVELHNEVMDEVDHTILTGQY